ncbi:hypothetical protein [Ruegeria sp.]|uniref:hypothetical protein n=1 Tax=Ruegeria sp. TaxID=1879320 RepID=UPI003C7D2F8C
MMILREPKLVFIKTKKTAGSSIEIALGRHLKAGDFATPMSPEEETHREGKRRIVRQSVRLLRERSDGAIQARQAHNGISVVNTYLPDVADGCFSFCVERNPWDKAISAFYFWMHQRRIEVIDPNAMFSQFCKTRLNYFSDFGLYSKDGKIVVDRVLRFENLAEEFDQLMTERGLQDTSLGQMRVNAGIRKSSRFDLFYGENWRGDNVQVVADVFSNEIDAFGYDIPSSSNEVVSG